MQAFLDVVNKVITAINDVVWGWPMIIMILGTGVLLTVLTRGLQVRKFKESVNTTIVPAVKEIGKKKDKSDKNTKTVSQFEAFSAAISGTVGTGNIIGVTSAILTGGPGAVFWMWLCAFFGMVTNYAENVLGLYYREKEKDGSFSGGAFYYIEKGIHQKWLAFFAAFVCLIAAMGMSGVQNNKICGTLSASFGFADSTMIKLIIGIVVSMCAALVIIGGIKRIGSVASKLVPIMSLLFIVMSVIILILNITAIPKAFSMIFGNIFGFKAMAGGFGGYLFGKVIQKGMARGVFSNEAGLGSSVIAHSASDTKEPVKQGLWGIFEVFFDTFVICTLTALIILTTTIHSGEIETLSAATSDSGLALSVFTQNFGLFGTIVFSVIIPLFAFTTIMAWSYYGEKACGYLFKGLGVKGQQVAVSCFKALFLIMIVASAVIKSDLVWAIDDAANGLMAIPNLIAVVLLSGKVVKITKNYFDRKAGKNVAPMLHADPQLNREFAKEREF